MLDIRVLGVLHQIVKRESMCPVLAGAGAGVPAGRAAVRLAAPAGGQRGAVHGAGRRRRLCAGFSWVWVRCLQAYVGCLCWQCICFAKLTINHRRKHRPAALRVNFMKLPCDRLQMAEGLAFMHEYGIIHRDIKGENFMFVEDPAFAVRLCASTLLKWRL
jgi:hypothetical protein